MRVEQSIGGRGSLKWIQQAVNQKWTSLEEPILRATGGQSLAWLSPLADDRFAEYRDAAFLERLDLSHLSGELAKFWPRRGPQWDALGRSDSGAIILVEAKAHVQEFCTPPSGARDKSRALIANRLLEVADDLGASGGSTWCDVFYQLANRLAHLWFLRNAGVDAFLALVGFVGDEDMSGPGVPEVWEAVTEVAFYAMGLPRSHKLSRFIIHVNPVVVNG